MHTELEVLSLLGRNRGFFLHDLAAYEAELTERIGGASLLVLGGAGSIGRQVVKALFSYQPARLHVVDVSENNLVELVRDVPRYFAVSSDKAANPANAMGASKGAMELCLVRAADRIDVASTRFANVAFSDGSLLQGFTRRLVKRQPLAAPRDLRRAGYATAAAGAAISAKTRTRLRPQ